VAAQRFAESLGKKPRELVDTGFSTLGLPTENGWSFQDRAVIRIGL
jgi:hypothetical protein